MSIRTRFEIETFLLGSHPTNARKAQALTAELEASVQEVECNGDASGSLTFIASGGWTQPFEDNNINPTNWGAEYGFTLTQQGTGQLYSHGSIDYAFDQDGNRIGYKTTFNNLPKGTYCLTISEDIAVNASDSDIKYSLPCESSYDITVGLALEIYSTLFLTSIHLKHSHFLPRAFILS